jgi:hypothetical protein
MKYLEFLDKTGTLTIPLIEHEVPEETVPASFVGRFVVFMDDLFDNIFWKSYYENIKKNK